MKLPGFCYQKAFWIVVPMLIVAFSSGVAAINAELNLLDERIRHNEVQIAQNNVPELKEIIKGMDQKIDSIIINQARLETKIEDLK